MITPLDGKTAPALGAEVTLFTHSPGKKPGFVAAGPIYLCYPACALTAAQLC